MDRELLLSFERLEERHWWFVVRRQIVLQTLRAAAGDDVASILEVGCGTGGTMRELCSQYPQAVVRGVEPFKEAADVARRSGCEITVASFAALPVEDEVVDVVVALDVLEHCDDDHLAAREAFRILRPGGAFVCTVPALPSLWGPHDDVNEHRRRYMRDTLGAPFVEAGFLIERMSYFNTILLPLGWVSRLVPRALGSRHTIGVDLPSAPVNAAMRGLFRLEVPLLRKTDLPIGMSLIVVARKSRAR